jgi:hypothetical protein
MSSARLRTRSRRSEGACGRGSLSRPIVLIATLAGFTFAVRRLGYKLGLNTIVRCRRGHLLTTIWIPGVKLKGLDLGIARLQRCPVGSHWSLVRPVRESDLTDEERALAHERRDLRIPWARIKRCTASIPPSVPRA